MRFPFCFASPSSACEKFVKTLLQCYSFCVCSKWGMTMQVEWLHSQQIVIYKVNEFTRQSINDSVETVMKIVRQWPAGQPYLALMDYTDNKSITLTPYYRQRSEDLLKAFPFLKGRSAIVMTKSSVAYSIKFYVKHGTGQKQSTLKRDVFFSRQDALSWLEEELVVESV